MMISKMRYDYWDPVVIGRFYAVINDFPTTVSSLLHLLGPKRYISFCTILKCNTT